MTTPAVPWICPQCGHSNRPGSRFCSRCRTQNPAFAPVAAETRRMPAGTTAGPAGRPATGGSSGPQPAPTPGQTAQAEILSAGRMLLDTVGTVPADGLEQWMLLRYQLLPALTALTDQLNGLPIPEWTTERGYVSD